MATFSVKDVLNGKAPSDTSVTVQGWVRTRRDSKAGVSFLALTDGSCFGTLQIVVPNTLFNYDAEVLHLTAGASFAATGNIVPSQGGGQSFEMQAERVQVFGLVEDPDTYPIQPKPHSMEFLRENAHLRARTNIMGAVARTRHSIAQAIHRFFHEQDFYWVNTPILTASDCEGAGEMFRVSTLDMMNFPKTPEGKPDFSKDFFGKETFLTVSGQLNVETYCMALSKVYTFGPTFRAENSNTSRHLAEFWMIEPEVAFADLAQNADLAEAMLKYVFTAVLNERADDMAFFEERVEKGVIAKLQNIIAKPFVRMDYTEAVNILQNCGQKFEYPVSWGTDLQSEHERYLAEKTRQWPSGSAKLSKRHQVFLHAHERRRQNRRSDGHLSPRHRRNHRRLTTRRTLRRIRRTHGRSRLSKRTVLLVPRPAPLRYSATRRFWLRLRTCCFLHHWCGQCARCDSVSAYTGECAVLSFWFGFE